MFYTELIKEIRNMLDLNVIFEENCLRKEKINGQICKVYTEKLFNIVENRQLPYL